MRGGVRMETEDGSLYLCFNQMIAVVRYLEKYGSMDLENPPSDSLKEFLTKEELKLCEHCKFKPQCPLMDE